MPAAGEFRDAHLWDVRSELPSPMSYAFSHRNLGDDVRHQTSRDRGCDPVLSMMPQNSTSIPYEMRAIPHIDRVLVGAN